MEYNLNFKDHAGRYYSSQRLECLGDDDARRLADFKHVPFIGNGYDLWQGDRLVAKIPDPSARK